MILPSLLLAVAADVTITLPAEATVRGTELVLGEIATLSEGAADALAGLSLGYAPAPGYTRLLQGWQIERAVEGAFPGTDVALAGAPAVRVRPLVTRVEAGVIEAAARAELAAVFAGRDVTLAAAGSLADVSLPAGDAAPAVRAHVDAGEARPGRWSVPVDLLVDGAVYRTVWTAWDVELWGTVHVLARDVRAGETLAPDLFVARRERLSHATSSAFAPSALTDAVALRDLPAGSVVRPTDARRPALVERGALVQLRVVKGAIVARITAHAAQEGRRGDRILVRTDAGREMTAVVLGRDLVEIDLTPTR